jgi:hypothetical protein
VLRVLCVCVACVCAVCEVRPLSPRRPVLCRAQPAGCACARALFVPTPPPPGTPHSTPQCNTLNTWRRTDCFKCAAARTATCTSVPVASKQAERALTADQLTTDVPGRILVLIGVSVTTSKQTVGPLACSPPLSTSFSVPLLTRGPTLHVTASRCCPAARCHVLWCCLEHPRGVRLGRALCEEALDAPCWCCRCWSRCHCTLWCARRWRTPFGPSRRCRRCTWTRTGRVPRTTPLCRTPSRWRSQSTAARR